MSSGRLLAAILVCILAGLVSIPLGLALGGFGICAASLSVGLVGGVAFVGAGFAGVVAALWRRVWWAGSAAFGVGMCFGLVFATESSRLISIIICAAATFFVAFAVRYPGPQSLKS